MAWCTTGAESCCHELDEYTKLSESFRQIIEYQDNCLGGGRMHWPCLRFYNKLQLKTRTQQQSMNANIYAHRT